MYLLDSNSTDAMTQESISGWQAYSNIPGGGLEPRLAYGGLLFPVVGRGYWVSSQDLCSDVLIGHCSQADR